MMSSVSRILILFLAIAASAASPAHADKAKAKALYQLATKHYNLNEFQSALDAFKDAYREFEEPSFLFNIGQCYRQLNAKLDALKFYRNYLREVPNSPRRDEVRSVMAALERSIAEEQAAKASPPQDTIPPQSQAPAAAQQQPQLLVPPPSVVASPARSDVSSSAGRGKRIAGLSLLVGGAAFLALGGTFTGLAKAANDDATANGAYDPSAEDRRDRFQVLDAVFWSVGAVAVAGGLTLYLLGRRDGRATRIASRVESFGFRF